MTPMTYTAVRENLAATMDKVCNDRTPIVITRNRDQAVVMLAKEDYDELVETASLLRSPKNARRLADAIEALETGRGKERQLPDE